MATEIKKESERTRELAERVAAHEATKPGEWTGGTYGQQIDDALNKILNREQFSYNLNADPLYNQYKDQYMRGGKLAMQDTMGQAAQLTGGYGNSYASTAGNQAYQGYLTGLNDKVPDLYSLALSKYSADGDAMRDNLGILQGMQGQEYDQYNQKMAEYRTELDRLDSLFADSQKWDYQNARDAVADAQWQAEFDMAVRQWNAANAGSKKKSGGGGGPYEAPPVEEPSEWAKRNLATAKNMIESTGVDKAKAMIQNKAKDGTLNETDYNYIVKQMGW